MARTARRTLVIRPGVQGSPPLPRRPADQPAPLSFAQEQIWLHGQLAPDIPLYSESLTIRHRGALDERALCAAFEAVGRRHALWRTTFAWADGEIRQQVHPELPVPLVVTDLRHLAPAAREDAAHRLVRSDLARPFDLSRQSGARARLVHLGDDDQRLYLCLHHLVFDGISIYRVVVPELVALYEAAVAGTPCRLPDPALEYADFAAWQRQSADDAMFGTLAAHWRERLAGAPPTLALPTDRPRPPIQSFRGGLVGFEFPPDLTAALREGARAEHCSVFMLLLAAYATTLYRWSRQDDFVIGSVSGGRDRPELDALVGNFLRMLLIRVEARGNPTFRVLLHRVREMLLDALGHDALPFQRLVRAIARERDLGRSPLFQVTCSIEPPLPDVGPAWDLTEMDAGTTVSKFDLSVELEDRGRVIAGRAIYSTDLFEPLTIHQLARDYVAIVALALAEPERRLNEFSTSRGGLDT